MNDLWPDEIGIGFKPKFRTSEMQQFLELQIAALSAKTDGAIDGQVRKTVYDEVSVYQFCIWPRGLPGSVFELFRLRAQSESYPVVVEGSHNRGLVSKLANMNQLKKYLGTLFSSETTLDAVKSIASEAIMVQADSNEKKNDETCTIVFGKLFDSGEESFSQASILGISGFMSRKTIENLARPLSSKSSAFKAFDDQYIVTIQFEGPVKFMISDSEVTAVRAHAKKILE
ncbi:hypothetical protein ACQKIK_18415 [Pseudomonas sp. NPDC047961]